MAECQILVCRPFALLYGINFQWSSWLSYIYNRGLGQHLSFSNYFLDEGYASWEVKFWFDALWYHLESSAKLWNYLVQSREQVIFITLCILYFHLGTTTSYFWNPSVVWTPFSQTHMKAWTYLILEFGTEVERQSYIIYSAISTLIVFVVHHGYWQEGV